MLYNYESLSHTSQANVRLMVDIENISEITWKLHYLCIPCNRKRGQM